MILEKDKMTLLDAWMEEEEKREAEDGDPRIAIPGDDVSGARFTQGDSKKIVTMFLAWASAGGYGLTDLEKETADARSYRILSVAYDDIEKAFDKVDEIISKNRHKAGRV